MSEGPARQPGRFRAGLWGVAGTLIAFAVMAWWLDLSVLGALWGPLKTPWLMAGLVITALQTLLLAARWRFTAERLQAPLSMEVAWSEYYRSLWWNQALPFGIGGDVMRTVRHAKSAGMPTAIKAVVLERVSGQAVLWVAAAASGAAAWGSHALGRVGVGIGVLGLMVAALYRTRAARNTLEQARDALWSRGAWVVQLGLSSALLLTHLALFVCAARALDVALSWQTLLIVVPLMLGAISLPVALAGWGVRELSAAALFASQGLPREQGAAIALLFGVLGLVGALPGLWLTLAQSMRPWFGDREDDPLGRGSRWHAWGMLLLIGAGAWAGHAAVIQGGALLLLTLAVALRTEHTPRLGMANVVTAVRLATVTYIGTAPAETGGLTLGVVGLAVLCMDGMDGWLARRQRTQSPYGAWFDMETDGLFVLALSAVLAARLGPWAWVPGLWRYVYVVTLQLLPARRQAPRSRWGRYSFVVVVSAQLLALLPLGSLSMALAAVGTFVISASFGRSLYDSYRPQTAPP